MAELGLKITLFNEIMENSFINGTLVEYKNGLGFSYEWGRSSITKAEISYKMINLETVNRGPRLYFNFEEWASLLSESIKNIEAILRDWDLQKERGVYYLQVPFGPNYALSPNGVDIPLKPNYQTKH